MTHQQSAVTLSVRVSPKIRDQLEELADATGRTKSFLAAEAIKRYITVQAWQVKAIKKSVEKSHSKRAKFIEHQMVEDWLMSWGTENEKESPK